MSNVATSPNVQSRINAAEQRVNEQHTRHAVKYEKEYDEFERGLGETMPLVYDKKGKATEHKLAWAPPTPQVLYKLRPGEVPSAMRQHMERPPKMTDDEVAAIIKMHEAA